MKKIFNSNFLMLILCFCVLFTAGCFGRTKPPLLVEQYTLEYAPPAADSSAHIDESIKIERFSAAQSFNSRAMLYRPQTYKLAAYNYNRWRVNPGDMATDFLARDFRTSNVFSAVFTYRDIEKTRFFIEGGVEEFLETIEDDSWKAVLKLNVSFIDGSQKELTKRLVFQKQYHFSESLKGHSPEEFARGMSLNMQRFSEQLIKDIKISQKML